MTPGFDPEVKDYTAATTNVTNNITATATDSNAAVAIELNGSHHDNGTAATWSEGSNSVVITVTNGILTETYTVEVTKS